MTLLLASALASGAQDGGSDKSAIESLITEFNSATALNDFDRLFALFAKNGDYGVGGSAPVAAGTAIRQVPPKKLPWDERMPLAMRIQKIQFIRPDVALVDAIQSDSSPMTGDSRKWSCTFVFVRVGREWKIASYRESLITARYAR